MAWAKKSRGGVSGWVAAALLALSIFAAVDGDQADSPVDDSGPALVEVSLQD